MYFSIGKILDNAEEFHSFARDKDCYDLSHKLLQYGISYKHIVKEYRRTNQFTQAKLKLFGSHDLSKFDMYSGFTQQEMEDRLFSNLFEHHWIAKDDRPVVYNFIEFDNPLLAMICESAIRDELKERGYSVHNQKIALESKTFMVAYSHGLTPSRCYLLFKRKI